jgi:hypothetical protein
LSKLENENFSLGFPFGILDIYKLNAKIFFWYPMQNKFSQALARKMVGIPKLHHKLHFR